MRTSYFAVVLALAVLSSSAWAQRVVILEIDGDAQGKLRAQIEGAVRAAGRPELIPLSKYREMAAARRMKGAAAMTPVGVARVGKRLGLDAAVTGEVTAKALNVIIYDRSGQELWSKTLKVKGGLLSEDFAGKLARAIGAAADQGAARQATEAGGEGEEGGSAAASEGADGSGSVGGEGGERRVIDPGAGAAAASSIPGEERDSDLDTEGKRRRRAEAYPPIIRFYLAGTTTWRSQCLRPGVASCAAYDDMAARRKADPKIWVPEGVTIDFAASAPYPGGSGNFELFPMARSDNKVLQGFGVLAGFAYGVSLTRIFEETPQGNSPEKTVISTDTAWSAQLAWRYHFAMGYGEPQALGLVGLRFGLQARNFTIDPSAGVPLPSSERTAPTGIGFPVVGIDASLPISKYFRLEGSGGFFVNPQTGAEQIIGYGNSKDPTGGVQSTGWSFDAGFAGDVWGPLGWATRVRVMSFADRYFGQGMKWTVCNDSQCGGAAEERFISVYWGLTAVY